MCVVEEPYYFKKRGEEKFFSCVRFSELASHTGSDAEKRELFCFHRVNVICSKELESTVLIQNLENFKFWTFYFVGETFLVKCVNICRYKFSF